MKGAAIAFVASVGVHALLAAVLVAWLSYAPEPDVVASLDVSSVELSLAENDDDSPVLAPIPPSPPSESSPRPETRPPDPPQIEVRPLPQDPNALCVNPPESEAVQMVEVREEARDETAPRQARIEAKPRLKKNIRPHYPDGARRRGEQGDVVLEILVEDDGSVGDVKVVASSGFGELDAAAVRAVRAARFNPAMSGGASVASSARLTLTFRLRN